MSATPPGESWEALGQFLARDLILLPRPSREELRGAWEELTRAEATLDDRLTVGLVGGTGVGKSTLINALAGAEISTAGDRRPTTSRVICYRHRRLQLPDALPRSDLAEPEILHETPELERVVLLDFPDFDSVEELHHEVLARYSAAIDVLIVLVDDVKYADARLFELLRRLPQAHENLHGVLNKLDRLAQRYPGRERVIAGEMLDDFAAKLETHAGIRTARDGLLALSARCALQNKLAGASLDSGDFGRLVELLGEYRQEKRRRAAKELNLEARREALRQKLRELGLDVAAGVKVDNARRAIDERSVELERIFGGVSPALVGRHERRAIASEALGRLVPTFGFPVDLIVSSLRALPFRRGWKEERPTLTAARVRQHYRGYLDGLKNLGKELASDLSTVVPRSDLLGPEDNFGDAPQELERSIARRLEAIPGSAGLWNHAPALVVGALYVWSVVHPVLTAAIQRLGGVEGATWSGVLRELVLGGLSSLSPLSIAGLLGALCLAYLFRALYVWGRRTQAVEAGVTDMEESLRTRAHARGERGIEAARASLKRWENERTELERLLGKP